MRGLALVRLAPLPPRPRVLTPPPLVISRAPLSMRRAALHRPCAHAFHAACIDKWLFECERTCPTCRDVVLPELPASALWPSPRAQGRASRLSLGGFTGSRDDSYFMRQHELEREAAHQRGLSDYLDYHQAERVSTNVLVGLLC